MEQESKEQDHADWRKFIRYNVLMTDLKTLATQFIARFDLQSKSAAYDALKPTPLKQLLGRDSCQMMCCKMENAVVQDRHLLPINNVEVKELRIARDEAKMDDPGYPLGSDHFATLGQEINWNVNDTDMIQKFRKFRAGNQCPFLLARDGIADLTQESPFCQTLDSTLLSIVRRVEPRPKHWPTLLPICDRVFVSNSYDEVARAIRSESMSDPIAAYLFVVIMAYWQYFQFQDDIPENINEREGFAGLTWTFMQTPLSMYGIQTCYLEVLITAVEGRKNQDKDHFVDAKEIGQYADAVAVHNNQQLFLAEAASVHRPKSEKRRQDEFKLAKAMRDAWIEHVGSISRLAVPHRGLAVFGSVSFKNETKLLRMDFQGAFRLQQFDLFIIPLNKDDFGGKMRAAIISFLELAARLHQETERRCQPPVALGYNDRTALADAGIKPKF
ncbi:hypothetical protein KI688_006576 [Linnemannia hyalina]|uniref:Uncharacterized protein n=1 Tax=Linnemannia hyalina TaxID=64524 RepID=A0A9P8BMZ5_9FUNG|nr:hypothetical protein KI688_006576 [Linnemannia hyalina]